MKNKKTNIPVIFVAVLMLLFLCVVGALFQAYISSPEKENNVPAKTVDLDSETKFASYFPGCNLMNGECLNSNCDQYFLCSDGKYISCEVYDCGEEFGVGTMDENKKIDTFRKIKDEREKLKEIKNECQGTVEILENQCLDENLIVKARVSTAGDCKISGFFVSYGEQKKPVLKFSNLGSELYAVSVSGCNDISQLIAIGKNGIIIE